MHVTTCDISIVTQLIAILFAVSCSSLIRAFSLLFNLFLYHHYHFIIIILVETIEIPTVQNGLCSVIATMMIYLCFLWDFFSSICVIAQSFFLLRVLKSSYHADDNLNLDISESNEEAFGLSIPNEGKKEHSSKSTHPHVRFTVGNQMDRCKWNRYCVVALPTVIIRLIRTIWNHPWPILDWLYGEWSNNKAMATQLKHFRASESMVSALVHCLLRNLGCETVRFHNFRFEMIANSITFWRVTFDKCDYRYACKICHMVQQSS